MFDEILKLVKDQLNGNQQVANAIPTENSDAVPHEIASQISSGFKNEASTPNGIEGLLSSIQNCFAGGSPVTGAITGGLVSSLSSKFGLSPAITGAIAGMLPGLLQKFASKVNDPEDTSVTLQSIRSHLGV